MSTDKPGTGSPETKLTPPASQVDRMRRLTMALAIAAAVFTACVAGVMVATYLDEPTDDQLRSDLLAQMKQQLAHEPTSARLKDEIRDLDVAVRERYFRHRTRFAGGAYLLLAGVIVLVAAARWHASLAPPGPRFERRAAIQTDDARWTPAASNVVAVAVIGAAIAVTLWAMGRNAPGRFPIPAASQPSLAAAPSAGTQPAAVQTAFHDNWPQFRGPSGMGVVPEGHWPGTWDAATNKNILWKCRLPMPGHSTPVVWGDRLYVTGADARRRVVVAIDRSTGTIVWTRDVPTELQEAPDVFEDTGYAAPSPVMNGQFVVAMFATSDVVGLDPSGKIVWSKSFGKPQSAYGLASSLVLYKDTVIIQLDQGRGDERLSSIMGLAMATNKTVWMMPREVPNSWSTPLVIRTAAREELITCANPWVIAYDPASGVELWRANVLAGAEVAAMPVFAGGLIYITNEGARVTALKPGGSGDVTATHVAWTADVGMSDTASPVCDGRFFLQARSDGLVTCLEATSGKLAWQKAFDGGFKASPILVGSRVYLSNEAGVTTVIELGPACRVQSTGTIGQKQFASLVFADSRIYVRGMKDLFCIGEGNSP